MVSCILDLNWHTVNLRTPLFPRPTDGRRSISTNNWKHGWKTSSGKLESNGLRVDENKYWVSDSRDSQSHNPNEVWCNTEITIA